MSKEITKSPFYILFVDDEENARKYFDKGLKNEFLVLTAASVEEAKNIISEKHSEIAVVITDQRMPGGNGIILLKYLRENYPHIIRLLTTAYSDLSEAIEAVNSGEILRYLQKPWDYNILKSEMKQAIELFELRFERNQMMREKLMVKKKMIKVERAKNLILIAKFFNFLSFSNSSIYNFINKFSRVEVLEDDKNWQDFDFGKQDVLETKFYLDLIEKLQKEIPQINYQEISSIDSSQIKSIFEQAAKQENLAINIEILNQSECKINQSSLEIISAKLMKIAKLSSSNSSLIIDKTPNSTLLKLNIGEIDLSKNSWQNLWQNENFFITSPINFISEFYLNLLICYLLAGNFKAEIEVSEIGDNENYEDNDKEKTQVEKNFSLTIKIPHQFNAESDFYNSSKSSSELLENTILATMIG